MGKVWRLKMEDTARYRAYYFEGAHADSSAQNVLFIRRINAGKPQQWSINNKDTITVDQYLSDDANDFSRKELVCEVDDIFNWLEEILEEK